MSDLREALAEALAAMSPATSVTGYLSRDRTKVVMQTLLTHAAREDVLNRVAKEFCAQAGFGWNKRTDDNKARLRECAKAALAAFLQDEGESR